MPKATIKMQQTQPLVRTPGATVTGSGLSQAPALTTTTMAAVSSSGGEASSDGMVSVLSIAALIVALVSLALVFLAYSASALS